MGRKIYVGNLSYNAGRNDLQQIFSAHGTVVSAQVITDRDTGRSKGFGFVEMATDQEARDAIAALNGKNFNGRNITVSEAHSQDSRSAGGGGFGRRGAFGVRSGPGGGGRGSRPGNAGRGGGSRF